MNVRLPKQYLAMSLKDQEVVNRVAKDIAMQALDESEVTLFVQYTKFACIVLNKYFGFGEQRLTNFIHNFKDLQSTHPGVRSLEQLQSMLDEEMAKIFKSGFPEEYVASLQRDE